MKTKYIEIGRHRGIFSNEHNRIGIPMKSKDLKYLETFFYKSKLYSGGNKI